MAYIHIFRRIHCGDLRDTYGSTQNMTAEREIAVGEQSNSPHRNVTPRCLPARRVSGLVREVTCTHTWPAPDGAI